MDLKGLGPKTFAKLNNQGLKTISDLLFFFPCRYIKHEFNTINDIEVDKSLILVCKVIEKPKIYFIRKNLDKLLLKVSIDNTIFNVSIFNRRYISKHLEINTHIVVTGKFLKNTNNFTASNISLLKNYQQGIIPQYNISNVKPATILKIYSEALKQGINLSETIPDYLLKKHRLIDINNLIHKIHQPKTEEDLYHSKRRIVYEELLMFALKIGFLKKINMETITKAKKYDIHKVRDLIKTLPFELTDDQKQATNEIFKDLKKNNQMNRLLQGDVGSGKTIISLIASYAVCTAKQQVAILAPTLVLAKQHLETFNTYLNGFNVKIELLTSDIPTKDKKSIKERVKNHEIDIIIGTHALLQDDLDFYDLGFIVIDEQHRFGVNQRKKLRLKGIKPDILLMSATPIPRTLAISIYKDIDVSFIKQKPKGRLPINTDIQNFDNLDFILDKIKIELDQGFQTYVICPLILDKDESTKLSVEEVYQLLKSKLNNQYTIDYLHGKMSDIEKTNVLNNFYQNQTSILVSTTVVEVGVNVPNATTMLIMNAENFGLSQLHQLRGRIGRSSYKSYCYLIVDDDLLANERLNILKETNDGFKISEYDLELRGPGEVFGHMQSGIPVFKMANLIKDEAILTQAFKDVKDILDAKDPISIALKEKAIKTIDSYNLD